MNVINKINKAVCDENVTTLMTLLKSPALNISTKLNIEESFLYFRLLKKCLNNKSKQNLWFDDIANIIDQVNNESQEIKGLTEILVQLNLAIVKGDKEEFFNVLSALDNVEKTYQDIYFQMFTKAYKKKGQNVCPWIVYHTDTGNTAYIDIESCSYSWSTPKDFVPYARYISKKDVHNIIEKINKHHINKYKQNEIEKCVIKIQAYCRGYLFRLKLKEKKHNYQENIDKIIKIQSWWRRVIVAKKYGTVIKMKLIEAKLNLQRKKNPWAWYKIQVSFCIILNNTFC